MLQQVGWMNLHIELISEQLKNFHTFCLVFLEKRVGLIRQFCSMAWERRGLISSQQPANPRRLPGDKIN